MLLPGTWSIAAAAPDDIVYNNQQSAQSSIALLDEVLRFILGLHEATCVSVHHELAVASSPVTRGGNAHAVSDSLVRQMNNG